MTRQAMEGAAQPLRDRVPASVATAPLPAAGVPGGPTHLANGSTSSLAPSAATTATHAASWQAMLNASLYDDDVGTLAPEQRAKREALDELRREYLEAKASEGLPSADPVTDGAWPPAQEAGLSLPGRKSQ